MADSFFGFNTSSSNLNDDEGAGEPSEDEYDALNDETFGADSETFDWEVEHEHLAERLERSRPSRNSSLDQSAAQLENSLSQLMLDDSDVPQSHSFSSSVWRHDAPFPAAPTPVSSMKNVCTVEELERQMRQTQQQPFAAQNYYQPRFPTVILQRPPGLQAPVPLPFAPQQTMPHINQMAQPLNKIIGPNTQLNPLSQTNLMQSQMGQNLNQLGQNVNQMGQNVNPIGQNMSQMSQNVTQFMQNANQIPNQFQNNQLGQNSMMNLSQNMQHQMPSSNPLFNNQMGQSMNLNQIGQNSNQNVNQMGQNMNQMSQSVNQMGQMGQNLNQLGQNVNQMIPNGNQFNPGMNQFPHMIGQPRMMGPPPGMNMSRQNFSPSLGQYNSTFRGPTGQSKPNDQPPMNQQNMLINHQMQQMKSQSTQMNQKQTVNQPIGPINHVIGQSNQPIGQGNQPIGHSNQPIGQNQPIGPGNQLLLQNNQPVGHGNQAIGHGNQPIGHGNQPIGHGNQHIGPVNHSIGQMNQPIGQSNHLNHSPQNKQPMTSQKVQNQNPNQRIDQKMQKSRVYNNSKNVTSQNVTPQNLTSQNLVQLIQNTHPMLQFNNSYHNANHHPMLNNRNSLFNNNQFMNNHLFNNQRHNGNYSNDLRHSMNGDDCSSHSDSDEYAGLMTQREKQWLINIQMLQLNTGTPYIHDFYYTVFLERQASKEKEGIKEAHKANQQNHPFYSGGVKQETHTRERHNSNRHNSTGEDGATPRTYVPTQFENSLGKLQCGSVTAPRKIIDVEVVAGETPSGRVSRAASVASTTNPAEVPREVKRTKQLLLDIEALYLILLRLEELNDPLAISNALILKEREEKQRLLELAQKEALENEQEDETNVFLRNIESVQRRPKQDSPKSENIDKRQVVSLAVNQKPTPAKNLLDEDKEDLMNRMFVGLLHCEKLPQMLAVRKGRTLLARFLRRVPGAHARLRALWSRVLRAAPAAARRDDGSLAALAAHYRKYIQSTSGWSAVLESCGLLSEALDPARTPYALTSSFTLSCVCALVEKAATLVNTPEATSNERQWSKFLKTLARALKNATLNIAKPIQPLPEAKLMHHIKQIESRSTIEILQRGRTAAEFADLSKADVSEQLMKHLC